MTTPADIHAALNNVAACGAFAPQPGISDAMQVVSAQMFIEAAQYHYDNHLRLYEEIYRDRDIAEAAGTLITDACPWRDLYGLQHPNFTKVRYEMFSYVAALGGFHYFLEKGLPKLYGYREEQLKAYKEVYEKVCPTLQAIMFWRHKHIAHRALDYPISESPTERIEIMIQAQHISHKEFNDKFYPILRYEKKHELDVRKQHPIILNEVHAYLLSLTS